MSSVNSAISSISSEARADAADTPSESSIIRTYIVYLSQFIIQSNANKPKIPDIQRPSARMIRTQLIIAFVLGFVNLTIFCFARRKFPKIYSSRILRRKGLPHIPKDSLIRWIKVVININETQVLEHAGLDAFVFLNFFKMAIKILIACSFFGFFVISPIRYHYTGGYDQGDGMKNIDTPSSPEEYEGYLWMYVVFTYTFTITISWFLFNQTNHVLSTRQEYLGKQNSITDRTIRLSGIPPDLRDEESLGRHIESLNIGKVFSVVICKEWKLLNMLFAQRRKKIIQLEKAWGDYLRPLNIDLKRNFAYQEIDSGIIALSNTNSSGSSTGPVEAQDNYSTHIDQVINGLSAVANSDPEEFDEESELLSRRVTFSNNLHNIDDSNSSISAGHINLTSAQLELQRPKIRIGFMQLVGKKVDAIDYLSGQLSSIDNQIQIYRNRHYPATPTAFITMESVASAQMVAQAVLDPHANYLTTELAPAPHDVIWDNVCLSRKERLAKSYYITVLISIISIALIFPVSYLAALLNTKTISKFFPELGEFLKNHSKIENFVTGLLPTYIFTLLNFIIPFFFVILSAKQGFVSHGEQELSTVSKNFFYLFVNLFLVFTLAGTASNYWSFLSDTTQIAKQLATSLRDLSLFYVDLIIFQGIGMFPFKLLLFGTVFRFPFLHSACKTPRQYKALYKPPIFNFGLALPQPLLVLIITIIYSVMSTKILVSGLAYFIIGYYVYKYQLMYSMVHPPHSTGKVWPLIFRRIILGLLIFQLTMAGLLALQNGFILAISLTPLPFITFGFLYDFQKHFVPLSYFIALRSIKHEDANDEARYSDVPPSSELSQNHADKSAIPPDVETSTVENLDSGNSTEDTSDHGADLEPSVSLASEFFSTINPNLFGRNYDSGRLDHHRSKSEVHHTKTLDEIREKNSTYEYSYLTQPLDGPWIAFDGGEIVTISDGITTRKKIEFFEWE